MAHLNFMQQPQQFHQQPTWNGSNTSINFPPGYYPPYSKPEWNPPGWNPMYPYPSMEHVHPCNYFSYLSG